MFIIIIVKYAVCHNADIILLQTLLLLLQYIINP